MSRKIVRIALIVLLGLGLGTAATAPAHAGRGIAESTWSYEVY